MSDRPFSFSTNKSLLRLTASDKFQNRLIDQGKPEYAHKAGAAPDYFLVDSEFDLRSLEKLVIVKDQRESILRGCFQAIFISQMVNLGLDRKDWPDVTDFDSFIECYDLKYVSFSGDAGKEAFRCEKILEEDL